MATNLFAPISQAANKPLVEFKAGKMTVVNKKVTPDKRKGLVQLFQSADSLIHFVWKDRTTGGVDDDLTIFPEEAIFKKVKQCTTGRVFLLEFKSSSRKMFYWMQETKDDKDDDNVSKINQYINNPPTGNQSLPSGLPGGIDQNALFQMLGGPRAQQSSQPRQPQPLPQSQHSQPQQPQSPLQSQPNVGMGDLQSILSGIGMPNSAVANLLQQPRQQSQQTTTPLQSTQPRSRTSLSQIMSADNVWPILMNYPSEVQQLLQFLPEGRRTAEELQQVLRSPQFQQSMDVFSAALQSGQLGEMIRQFGIQTGNPTTIESFLQSLQSSSSKPSSTTEKKDDKEKKDDDKMDI